MKRLERLNLYYNSIPSLQEVKVLWQLTALRELDLRLNPLAKTDPHYRLYFVHALSNLRRLGTYSYHIFIVGPIGCPMTLLLDSYFYQSDI